MKIKVEMMVEQQCECLSPRQNDVLKEPGQTDGIFGQGNDPEQLSNLRKVT